MTIAEQPQTGLLNEQIIEDSELSHLLEERQTLNERRKEAAKAFRDLDTVVKGRISAKGVGGEARCGRFIITSEERPGRSVSFETSPRRIIRIRPVGEE